MASPQKPSPLRTAAYATLEEKTLYIVGGFTGPLPVGSPTAPTVNQVASLDLTVSWNASSPRWTILPPLPSTPALDPLLAVIPKAQNQLLVATGESSAAGLPVWTFDFESQSWTSNAFSFPAEYTESSGVLAALNPLTDTIVVPTGTNAGTSTYVTFLYNIANRQYTTAPGPEAVGTTVPATLREYAIAWSSVRSSVLVYGGRGALPGNQWQYSSSLIEFSSGAWKELTVSGPSPGGSNWGCLVPAYNGRKMVLFGGFTRDILTPSIYILDVGTLAWTKGEDIPASLMRSEHVCTAAGDSFVAWGGLDSMNKSTTFQDPVIYDLKAGRWTDKFALVSPSPPSEPSGGRSTSGDGPSPPKGGESASSSNTGAIAGGVVGGLALLLVGGFLLFRRRRQSRQKEPLPAKSTHKVDLEHLPPSEPWSKDYLPPSPRTAQTFSTQADASTAVFATPVSNPSPRGSTLGTRSPQEYPAVQRPQEHYPPPPVPLRPQGLSSYDPRLTAVDTAAFTSPYSEDPIHHEKAYGAAYTDQPTQIRNPQQRESIVGETDLERRLRIERQEIEQLELAHLIQEKKLNMERLLEAQRIQARSPQN